MDNLTIVISPLVVNPGIDPGINVPYGANFQVQFQAKVYDQTTRQYDNSGVTWSCSSGQITSTGLYALQSQGGAHDIVVATSVKNPLLSSFAIIDSSLVGSWSV